MSVVKLAHSRRSVHFIDDQGNVFVTPVQGLRWLVPYECPSCHHEFGGTWSKPIVLVRLPVPVPPDKFKVSPVFNPTTGQAVSSDNGYDPKFIKSRAEAAAYTDKVVE